MSNKEFKLSEIAKKLDLSFEGDPNYKVNSIKNLKEAGKFDISFYYSKKFYIKYLIKHFFYVSFLILG